MFSGGLDSSYLLARLSKMEFRKIIAVAVDLGEEDNQNLSMITDKLGVELKIIDAKVYFAKNSVIPAIQAQAIYLNMFPVSSSLSRPVIAKKSMQVAIDNDCDVLLHTANQSQNSLRRLNGSIQSLKFDGYYGSPYEYSAISRKEKAKFLEKFGFSFLTNRKLSGDENLWCREYESGELDNPESFCLNESLYKWSVKSKYNHKDRIKLTFKNGVPVAIDDKSTDIVKLIKLLNYRIGLSGVGRYAGLEHLPNQEKVLEIREMPAASILLNSFKHLEMAILTTPLIMEKSRMGQI
ncbi:Argininosuccinate synthase [Bathymodiolus heckerae thiotrophic gill symbiont]|nr:Argininosuccinate synthase [Bathymodiolus heckerae thiotrophic gill symbiont]